MLCNTIECFSCQIIDWQGGYMNCTQSQGDDKCIYFSSFPSTICTSILSHSKARNYMKKQGAIFLNF